VSVDDLGAELGLGPPVALFSVPPIVSDRVANSYVATRDGERFLVAEAVLHDSGDPPIRVVLNWPALLQR
jgi:hypothetical protein